MVTEAFAIATSGRPAVLTTSPKERTEGLLRNIGNLRPSARDSCGSFD